MIALPGYIGITRPVLGARGYDVTMRGDVISNRARGGPCTLQQFDRRLMNGRPSGYLSVCIHDDASGKRRNRYVHEIVVSSFVGPRPSELHEVLHGDGCRANNWLYNLRWGTVEENAADRERHGGTHRGDAWYAARGLPPPWLREQWARDAVDAAEREIELAVMGERTGAFDDLL